MNKLFKLIYVNLLGLFDINKIIIAREDGVKSNLEKRTILLGLINVVYAYFLYIILDKLTLKDNTILLVIGFLISTVFCFVSNLSVVEPLIFKMDDTDFLFSYPVSRNQILFSKLFTIYLKNLITVALFMIVSFLAYYNSGVMVTETIFIMVLLVSLLIPVIPIILATIISYVDDYYKTKTHNSIIYKLIKYIVLILVVLLTILLFKDIGSNTLNGIVENIVNKFNIVYPFTIIFHAMLVKESILLFVIMIFIPIICCYLYSLIITNNYLKICSLLKGVKKNNKFDLKKIKNRKKLGGLTNKELVSLLKNKLYLTNTFGFSVVATILLLIVCIVVDFREFNIERIDLYINLYVPTILSLLGSMGCSTISSMSLEKDNMQILRTLPISMNKVLFSKWLTNMIVGLVFVLINGTIATIFLNMDKWSIMFSYVLPLLALSLVSLTGLVLDYRFIEKNESEDNVIVRQRLITMIPIFVSLCIGVVPFFLPIYNQYRYSLGAYMMVFIIVMIIECLYLLINRKKLVNNLFK